MKNRQICAAAIAVAGLAGGAFAQAPDEMAARYAAMPTVEDIALSPSGKRLAVVQPGPADTQLILTADLTGPTIKLVPIMQNKEVGTHIAWCDWASDERLLCDVALRGVIDATDVMFSRMLIVNADGSDAQMLSAEQDSRALGIAQDGGSIISWRGGEDEDAVLMTRQFIKEFSTGSRLASDEEGLGVDYIDLNTLRRRVVEKARKEATRYVADDAGQVRILHERDITNAGRLLDSVRYMYRPLEGGFWRPLEVASPGPSDFVPVAVDSTKNVAYGFADHDGFNSIFEVKLDGSGSSKLLLSRPGIDVDRLVRTGPGGKVVGASYATDRRTIEFFDPELSALQKAFRKALPGNPLIEFADASRDGSKLLIIASGDTDPGMVYLYDKNTKRLEEVLPLREPLAGAAMGQMTPVTYTARDGAEIPAYLTLPPDGPKRGLPAIVMPHGGPSARDEWGFDWLVQYFVHRGFAVLQPNYRGSSGYGTNWFGGNGFRDWPVAIGDVNDAGRWLVAEGIAEPDKLAVVGWSYGGYAALQSQVVDPELYRAVVAIAPVTDLDMVKDEAREYTNWGLVAQFVGSGPHVAAGSPARHPGQFRSPVLLIHGEEDLNVGIAQSRRMEHELRSAGKTVRLIEFPDLAHSLENSRARYTLLTESDAFLREHLGM
ncbi:alpha/beta fold hydrolase [Qipengyuania sp. MTN3-11]|uniref:alpha/beta hydrolase family protein n=1 Tax=Qipengyuania sp. MTN3-11 TaxID=3056557 RepID=UPI0036F3A2C5